MAEHDKFFQFPLHLLAMPDTPDRAQAIMYYSIIEHGRKAAAEMTTPELMGELDAPDELPRGLKKNDRRHLEMAYGQKLMGITKGTASTAVEAHKECWKIVSEYTRKHGADAVCRMRRDLLFKVRDGQMTWRDFSTLAAVYSIIGGKPFPVLVYRSMLQARQLGFKSPAIMAIELAGRDDVEALTEKALPGLWGGFVWAWAKS